MLKKFNNERIKANMQKSYIKIRKSYRLDRRPEWLTPNNHNFLRISRILRSLHVFGLNKEADEFFGYLSKIYENIPKIISEKTWEIWNERNRIQN